MTKKAAINRKSISVGPNIVRAWFDTVINPLLEALEREQELLGRKNWSWRYLPEQLEYFRPAQAYLSHRTRSNAEQFFDLFPQIKSAVAKHDKAVDALTNACLRLQKSLLDSAALRTVYEQTTTPESLAELEAKLSDLVDKAGAFESRRTESGHVQIRLKHVPAKGKK